MKRIFAAVLVALITMPIVADNTKLRVAVFDPSLSGTHIDEGTKVAIREIISSAMVNSGNFEIVERSLLEKVMQEQRFSNSGIVDDNDATEIGKLAGANKVVISVLTQTGGQYMLSVKMIDVKTASVDKQRIKIVDSGNLLNIVEPITKEMIGTGDSSSIENKENNFASLKSSVSDNELIPGEDEIIIHLLPYSGPTNLPVFTPGPVTVSIDKEPFGGGKLLDGFVLRIKISSLKKLKKGKEHQLKLVYNSLYKFVAGRGQILSGAMGVKIPLEPDKYNYYCFDSSISPEERFMVALKDKKLIK